MDTTTKSGILTERIGIEAFDEIHQRCAKVISRVRERMLHPQSNKQSPRFPSSQVAALLGLDLKQFDYRVKKGELPPGEMSAGRRRFFSVGDVRNAARIVRKKRLRPEGAEAVVVCIANFKGGVAKTTSSVTLAQGLALRGHRVLMVDADPQASATSLFGVLAEIEVDEDQTILPLCRGDEDSIDYAIRPTYWDGISLVPAVSDLFGAEFDLPSRQVGNKGFEFWNVLNNGIDTARLEYDVIIIDTPPALSYITINALMAADGIIMPLPPNALDFLSSGQFWGLVSSLTNQLQNHGSKKKFDFLDVVLSKVDPDDTATPVVREWIKAAYADKLMSVEIPLTASAGSASAEFGTVYDQPRKRATAAYDRFVELIEDQVNFAWARQIAMVASREAA